MHGRYFITFLEIGFIKERQDGGDVGRSEARSGDLADTVVFDIGNVEVAGRI